MKGKNIKMADNSKKSSTLMLSFLISLILILIFILFFIKIVASGNQSQNDETSVSVQRMTTEAATSEKITQTVNSQTQTAVQMTSLSKTSVEVTAEVTTTVSTVTTSDVIITSAAETTVLKSDDKPTATPTADPKHPWANKKVYLTFDDGPSGHTEKIIDILNDYGIKATWFVIGTSDKKLQAKYKLIVDNGNTIGMHSYSHDYDKIYGSVKVFAKDYKKIASLLQEEIGYVPDLYRFPGGSSNSKCKKLTIQPFISYLEKKNVRYFDWNVVTGDAEGIAYTDDELIQNALDGIEEHTICVVLMHDTDSKQQTLDTLPELIEDIQEKGAQILPITEDTPEIRHVLPDDEKK